MTVALLVAAGCGATPAGGAAGAASTATRSGSPHASAPGSPRAVARAASLHVRQVRWRLPGPLAREAVIGLADARRFVVAGGLLPGDRSSGSTYTLDPATGRTTPGPSLGVPVHDTAGALVGGVPTVVGGGNAAEQAVVQQAAGSGWRTVGRLPSARSDLAVVAAGRTAYAVGGYDGTQPAQADVLRSTDGTTWSVAAHLPEPVRYPAVVVEGGALWVFGGERSGRELDVVQRIDLGTGSARVVARMPGALGHESAALLAGRVLLAGGRDSAGDPTDRLWWFDPATRRFTSAGRLPTMLADSAVAAVGTDTVYLLGGESPSLTDRVIRLRWR